MGRLTERRITDEARSDDDLIVAIAQGNQQAFRRLMERHGRPMLALAQRLTQSADDADEIVQEAFLKVWRTAGRWQPNGKASFSTWFYRVVLNACIDRRRRATMSALDDVDEPVDPAPIGVETAQTRQRRDNILAALNALPQRQKEAISLCYFGEITSTEAAAILNISVSALESLLVRGRRGLKQALEQRGIHAIGDIL